MSDKLLIINCAALSWGVFSKFAQDNDFMRKISEGWQSKPMKPVFPAVTMPVQATMITGSYPSEHGCVSNSRFDRRTLQYDSWEQSSLLLDRRPFWTKPEYKKKKIATVCMQGAYFNDADFVVSPAPIHDRSGSAVSAIYSYPEELAEILIGEFGEFPLKHYWGPFAGFQSTDWIFRATCYLILDYSPDVIFTYFPMLDYTFQRLKHSSHKVNEDLTKLGSYIEKMITFASRKKYRIMLVSEYGITEVEQAVPINMMLRKKGFLNVRTAAGYDQIDPYLSKAWALVDHQIAHIFVRDQKNIEEVASVVKQFEGVEEVLFGDDLKKLRINHSNSGEIVAIADENSWFNYHFWKDNAKMPPYARTVDIHNKPGYDPLELFFNRSTMTVETSNVGLVRGSHGRMPDDMADYALFATDADILDSDRESVEVIEIPELIGRIVL